MNISISPVAPLGDQPTLSASMPELDMFAEEMHPIETRILMSIIFLTLSAVGIIGNLLVIVVVSKVRGMVSGMRKNNYEPKFRGI